MTDHEKRVHDLMYSCESRDEMCERVIAMEELVRDMFRDFADCDFTLREHGRTFMAVERYLPRLQELGIEVE